MSRTTGRPAEVLREGSGIEVDETTDEGLAAHHIAYIKDVGNLPCHKTSRGCCIFKVALSNEFLLGCDRGRVF